LPHLGTISDLIPRTIRQLEKRKVVNCQNINLFSLDEWRSQKLRRNISTRL
jgi:hypothetical protein